MTLAKACAKHFFGDLVNSFSPKGGGDKHKEVVSQSQCASSIDKDEGTVNQAVLLSVLPLLGAAQQSFP